MTWPKATHQKVIGKMNNPFTNWSLMFLDVSRVQYIGKCQTSVWMVSVPIFFLKKTVLILNFLVPWPTKSLPTLFFLKHIAMFGCNCGLGRPSWMRVFKRLHMKPLHHIHIHRCRFMYMNHNKHTYQTTHHHKCTAYQHLCRFMDVNREQTYQLTYHHKS